METYSDRRAALIAAVMKPLSFASRDGCAGVDKLKGMEALVEALDKEAQTLLSDSGGTAGAALSTCLKRLAALFAGFDTETTEVKKRKVAEAIGLVSSLQLFATTTPPPALQGRGSGAVSAVPVAKRVEELKRPVQFVKGVGPRLGALLGKKGIGTVEDLLYFIPIRYEDRSRRRTIRELVKGESASVVATVVAAGESRYGRRRVYEIVVTDSTGLLKLKWFNFKASYMKRFKKDGKYLIYGLVSAWGRQVEMVHPDLEPFDSDGECGGADGDGTPAEKGLLPVYSQIERLHQKSIRKIMLGALASFSSSVVSAVPDVVARRYGLLDLESAFKTVHLPGAGGEAAVKRAKKSLAFDELFMLEIGLAIKRQGVKRSPGIELSAALPGARNLAEELIKSLPFKLTGAQESVLGEIKKDMAAPHPMNRLLQGDVGSGKTVVCLVAALVAVGAGYQVAIMAPTEILAEQHTHVIKEYTARLGVTTALLTSGVPGKEKRLLLDSIAGGGVDIVVGTHALIQKGVDFSRLALVVIDEQHRFGVVQRAELKRKGVKGADATPKPPDMLIMTATPIPRTLTMTLFSDLEVSVIDELPPGRQPVLTTLLREADRQRAYATIRRELESGAQAYVVCPLVEESEELGLIDAVRTKERLEKEVFSEFNVGLIHGRMSGSEKETVMRSFKAGEIDLLVATTVIEVGVDVPNATVMLIEHAERFGLAQLHQLRGRVGRGKGRSVCILLAQWSRSEETLRRLKVMEETGDGFIIAEEDLAIRGPGDFIGTRQSGLPEFRFSASLGDLDLLKSARESAAAYLKADPDLLSPHSVVIKEVLKARWKERLELAEIG